MTEPETIEAEVEEIVGQALEVHQPAPVSLFHTDDPVSVVEKATQVADALAAVVEGKQLYTQIGKKKHVQVEGWTLLGSMLGVFPVVEWTKSIMGGEGRAHGYEARAIAVTRSGDTVGAAEAMCTRAEKRWKDADDYALRSMAQTRAVSKALRHPLGFVMTLAGYEATPEAEMPSGEPAPARVEGPEPLRAPTSWAKVTEMVGAYDEGTFALFTAFGDAARRYLFPGSVDASSLPKEEKDQLFQVTARAALALRNAVDAAKFPPPSEEDVRAAWASALEGVELALPKEEE